MGGWGRVEGVWRRCEGGVEIIRPLLSKHSARRCQSAAVPSSTAVPLSQTPYPCPCLPTGTPPQVNGQRLEYLSDIVPFLLDALPAELTPPPAPPLPAHWNATAGQRPAPGAPVRQLLVGGGWRGGWRVVSTCLLACLLGWSLARSFACLKKENLQAPPLSPCAAPVLKTRQAKHPALPIPPAALAPPFHPAAPAHPSCCPCCPALPPCCPGHGTRASPSTPPPPWRSHCWAPTERCCVPRCPPSGALTWVSRCVYVHGSTWWYSLQRSAWAPAGLHTCVRACWGEAVGGSCSGADAGAWASRAAC